jgi:hypothetical protein
MGYARIESRDAQLFEVVLGFSGCREKSASMTYAYSFFGFEGYIVGLGCVRYLDWRWIPYCVFFFDR